ncbi:MAG TPA: hypothetical protein VF076_07170 [Acidimicrobiales bacterium]
MQMYGTYRCHYPDGFRPGPQAVHTRRTHRVRDGVMTAVGVPLMIAPTVAAFVGADSLFYALQVPVAAFALLAARLGWPDKR